MEKKKMGMFEVRPVYKWLLILAIAIYVAAVSAINADLYYRVGRLEHKLMHITGECSINR